MVTPFKHGTLNGYNAHRCRCAECRAVAAEAARKGRVARHAELEVRNRRAYHPRAPHGTANGYNYYGCRCYECTTANTLNVAIDRQKPRSKK